MADADTSPNLKKVLKIDFGLADKSALPQQISARLIRGPIALFQQIIDIDLVVNDRKNDRNDRYGNAPCERPSTDLQNSNDQGPFPVPTK